MEKLRHVIIGFVKDETGAAAAEYALIIGAVSLLIVAGAILLGTAIGTFFSDLATWFGKMSTYVKGLAAPGSPAPPA